MPFDADRFNAWKPSDEHMARARREWELIILGMESARSFDRLAALAAQRDKRTPRKGSKAWHFLQVLVKHPELPAARINALLPESMDEATARRLAREWRGWV